MTVNLGAFRGGVDSSLDWPVNRRSEGNSLERARRLVVNPIEAGLGLPGPEDEMEMKVLTHP